MRRSVIPVQSSVTDVAATCCQSNA